MAELYQIVRSGFAFEETADGYIKVPPPVIGKYFEHARGDATDLYVIKHYTKKGAVEFAHGYVPTGEIGSYVELRNKQEILEQKLDEAKKIAKEIITTPTKVYQSRDNEYAFVFVPCQDGYIGCGWYDHAATETKGLKMAAFVVYAYGVLNSEVDEVFWKVAYKYLPYASKLGRADAADDIIFMAIKDSVIESNNQPTRVININGKKKVPNE